MFSLHVTCHVFSVEVERLDFNITDYTCEEHTLTHSDILENAACCVSHAENKTR